MHKKIIIISLTIGVILLVVGGVLLVNNNTSNSKLVDEIIDKKDKKETELVFVTSSDSSCYLCSDAKDFVDSVAKKYNLEFTTFDKSKSSKDYKDLQKKLDITDKQIKEPAVIIIKDGKLKSIANEMINSSTLRNMLINEKIITDETKNDKETTIAEVMEKFKGQENSLLVILDSSTNSVNARDTINELASKYNFTYDLTYFDKSDEGMSITTFINQMNGDDLVVVPYFVIISNNKVVDHLSSLSSNKIETFLKKNKIINA